MKRPPPRAKPLRGQCTAVARRERRRPRTRTQSPSVPVALPSVWNCFGGEHLHCEQFVSALGHRPLSVRALPITSTLEASWRHGGFGVLGAGHSRARLKATQRFRITHLAFERVLLEASSISPPVTYRGSRNSTPGQSAVENIHFPSRFQRGVLELAIKSEAGARRTLTRREKRDMRHRWMGWDPPSKTPGSPWVNTPILAIRGPNIRVLNTTILDPAAHRAILNCLAESELGELERSVDCLGSL